MPTARAVLERTRKAQDLPWNLWVCRPLAAPLVALLAPTRVTPDQVTLAAFGVAVTASLVLALLPGLGGLWLGVLLVEAAYVLDCADGMLARWRGQASASGHLLDFLMDELKAFLLVAAVAVRLHQETGESLWLQIGLGGLLALASGTALTTFLRRPEHGAPAAPATRARAGVAGRLLSLASGALHYPSWIWVVPIAGRAELFLVPYAALHALHALYALAGVAWRFGRAR